MGWIKRPSGLTLVTAALLVLLPALAVLQSRWVGQVSAAERDRMERNLRVGAYQFRQAFDGELGRASLLQVGPATVRDGSSERYSDNYDLWLSTTVHPRMVANVYLLDADGSELRLRRWNADARVFESVAWPAQIENWRSQFEQERREYSATRRDRRPPAIRDDALLVFPVPRTSTARADPSARSSRRRE